MMNFFLLMLTWLICYLVTREKKTSNWSSCKPTSKEDNLRSLIDCDKHNEDIQRSIGNEVIANSLREKWMKNEEELEALKKAKQEEWERSLKNPTFEQKVLFYSCTVLLWIGIIAFIIFFYYTLIPQHYYKLNFLST